MEVQEQWELFNTHGCATCCTSPSPSMRGIGYLAVHTTTPIMVPYVWVGPGIYFARNGGAGAVGVAEHAWFCDLLHLSCTQNAQEKTFGGAYPYPHHGTPCLGWSKILFCRHGGAGGRDLTKSGPDFQISPAKCALTLRYTKKRFCQCMRGKDKRAKQPGC